MFDIGNVLNLSGVCWASMEFVGGFENLRAEKVWGRHFGDEILESRGWKSVHKIGIFGQIFGYDF